MSATPRELDVARAGTRQRASHVALWQVPDRLALTIAALGTASVAAAVVVAVIRADMLGAPPEVDWPVLAFLALGLLVGETSRRCWIRSGPDTYVTPVYLFAFALLLVGSSTGALAAAIVGTVAHAFVVRAALSSTLMRLSKIALTVGSAAAVAMWLDATWSMDNVDGVSWRWVVGATMIGGTILVVDGIVTAIEEAARSRVALTTGLVRGVGAWVTAEGALLSLAPIWIVGVEFSRALAPLLAITTVLVFQSTRQAFERAYEARHDALTGLANRRAFAERVDMVVGGAGGSTSAMVMLIDLDRFKEVNDELGHDVGDAVLSTFARRLADCLPPTAVAARLAGDEFAVLQPLRTNPDGSAEVERLISALSDELAHPLWVRGFPIRVDASVGAAFAPRDGRTASDLLRAADIAMYRAKRLATKVERYDDCVRVERRGHVELLGDIDAALNEGQFTVHVQPQVRMDTGAVDAVEALIRWDHPLYGRINPNDFIALVEQTELIGRVTEMVLRTSTLGLRMSGIDDVKLAVNVSRRSLQDRNFSSLVLGVLADVGFPPSRLEVEVTERALGANPERSWFTVDRLRAAGVSIAVDDFGTGYSSFETLRQLPVDRVKVDAVFVGGLLSNEADRVIVESVVDLAHRLGFGVVAEGIETRETWNALAALGCDFAQGFGIARPMPLTELRAWLTKRAVAPTGPLPPPTGVPVPAALPAPPPGARPLPPAP
jgi:diguanylate cyclase (GGDEF)-like protein